MKLLFFGKKSEKEATFYRCAVCGQDKPASGAVASVGCHVQLANEVLAIVCGGQCFEAARQRIVGVLGSSLVNVDSRGYEVSEVA